MEADTEVKVMDNHRVMNLVVKALYFGKPHNVLHTDLQRLLTTEYCMFYGHENDLPLVDSIKRDT